MTTEDSRYEAVRSRDARFDGVFFLGVRTTGIYCRPSCPAVTPKRENVRFYPTAAAAQAAGFRACRRCRPDAVPGSAEWNVRADLVGRAMRMISDGVVDREGVAGLSRRLGYSSRQVQRQLTAELGAGPVALARAQRAHTARVLLQTTPLPVTQVAFAAGFASVRQFNDTVREIYARTPSALRAASARGGHGPAGRPEAREAAAHGGAAVAGVPLRLAYRGGYDTGQVFGFLARRAVPGVEEVRGAPGGRTYRWTLNLPYGIGIAEVDECAARSGKGWLDCRLHLGDLRDLTTAVQRVRRLFDLDADPYAVVERLGGEPALGRLVSRTPGLRSPGAADAHELAVRAVLGQQVTVGAARTLGGRLVAAYGKPLAAPDGTLTHLFPDAGTLAEAPLGELGMPQTRRRTIRTVAAALADGTVVLDPGADREETGRALLELPGIGPWTAGYIRMRALSDPDVFLPGDAGVRHGLALIGAEAGQADRWRPWRSYALHHLWHATGLTPPPAPN
ncbi:AraC family transcriptional regulator, regulatory protein of adaptative response / DNA-3-methyladenine glycosylase II [Streptomyces qinglanensis]|uniref:DNA-3-methyladenine glycosylase II n=3 Tax=Streptomyces qinglanensis TaxID=943816 RepID=A0A1H9RZ25_9ACTN|nr:AlkA N-terminal domain-containing protein [Streptomyces qinglanensis]SER77908.1 AraC family transcriptional regulator, regulatory protein of adaptative response / DNA-3-methyladenine glycosylase II [Streptomyces qinglanensis]